MSSTISDRTVPFGVGAGGGVLAWLVGYVCTYLVAGTQIRESALNRVLEFLGQDAAVYKLVGWIFFNSHFVDTVFEGLPITAATNAVGGEAGFTPLLYVVPPALLLAAGLAVGRSQGAETPGDGAVAGATVVPGYLLCSVIGAVLFPISAGPATARPDLLLAVVLAGVVYPVVFGAGGGALAGATGSE